MARDFLKSILGIPDALYKSAEQLVAPKAKEKPAPKPPDVAAQARAQEQVARVQNDKVHREQGIGEVHNRLDNIFRRLDPEEPAADETRIFRVKTPREKPKPRADIFRPPAPPPPRELTAEERRREEANLEWNQMMSVAVPGSERIVGPAYSNEPKREESYQVELLKNKRQNIQDTLNNPNISGQLRRDLGNDLGRLEQQIRDVRAAERRAENGNQASV